MKVKYIKSDGTENQDVHLRLSTFFTIPIGLDNSSFENGTKHAPTNRDE